MKFYKKDLTANEIFKLLKNLNIEHTALLFLKIVLTNLNYVDWILDIFNVKVKRKFDFEFYTKGSGKNERVKVKLYYGLFKRKSYIVTCCTN